MILSKNTMFFLIFLGKTISTISRLLNRGNGSTWPGHIALSARKNFIKDMLRKNPQLKIVLVVGTNGKTTTGLMVTEILRKANKRVLQNLSGANLINGIASSLLLQANWRSKIPFEYAVFEVDENSLPLVTEQIVPRAIIALNLFRDQLDRYGELDSIAKKWKAVFEKLSSTTSLILNADDPLIAWLGLDLAAQVKYFGLPEKEMKATELISSADSIYCPRCGTKLRYKKISYSHLGDWSCPSCHLARPKVTSSWRLYPLPGTYNMYNTLAVVIFAKSIGIYDDVIQKGFADIKPAFGRQEVIEVKGKKVQIFLSKNPTSMNQSLETVAEIASSREARSRNDVIVLFVLNDNIPDGRDVSWIWDVDMESYLHAFTKIVISGERCYDMGLRIQYASPRHSREGGNPWIPDQVGDDVRGKGNDSEKFKVFENLRDAIENGLASIKEGETLYILPTYSAMIEVRKILTGKGIL